MSDIEAVDSVASALGTAPSREVETPPPAPAPAPVQQQAPIPDYQGTKVDTSA